MFGHDKQNKLKASRVSTIIGQGTEIHGDILFGSGLQVDGTIRGNVKAKDDSQAVLIVSELGVIKGDVLVPMIMLNGAVFGNVFASERVELASKSRVTGDVTYKLLEMAAGSEVNGRLIRKDSVNPPPVATETNTAGEERKVPPANPVNLGGERTLKEKLASKERLIKPRSHERADPTERDPAHK